MNMDATDHSQATIACQPYPLFHRVDDRKRWRIPRLRLMCPHCRRICIMREERYNKDPGLIIKCPHCEGVGKVNRKSKWKEQEDAKKMDRSES